MIKYQISDNNNDSLLGIATEMYGSLANFAFGGGNIELYPTPGIPNKLISKGQLIQRFHKNSLSMILLIIPLKQNPGLGNLNNHLILTKLPRITNGLQIDL